MNQLKHRLDTRKLVILGCAIKIMQSNQAIFIIGSPGSGKDVIIRDIISNYNIIEFTSTQLDEMLSDDVAFKRSKVEKRNSLLESKSILVTANSYDLGFIITKTVLESIGYSSHLIIVEANISVAYDRLQNRKDLKESLNKISLSNSNKESILKEFNSSIIIDNSEQLNLCFQRTFISNILSDLKFESKLKLSDIVKPKLKSKIVPAQSAIGDVGTVVFTGHMESIDSPSFDMPTLGSGSVESIPKNSSSTFMKAKKILFKKKVIPNGI